MRKLLLFSFVIAVAGMCLSTCNKAINECQGTCGKIYVANEGHESITVIDASDYKVLKFIHVVDEHDMLMIHNIQA